MNISAHRYLIVDSRKEIIGWLKSNFGDPLELKWTLLKGMSDGPSIYLRIWDSDIRLLLLLKYSDHIRELE